MTNEARTSAMPQWVQEHIAEYLQDGVKGHDKMGTPALLLTTTGKRSGEPLLLPLFYGEEGGSFVVVASKGGTPENPDWYTNLVANPEVEVQVRNDKFSAIARTATEEEKPALWEKMAKIWPAYNDYQAKTERAIPVVILEPKA